MVPLMKRTLLSALIFLAFIENCVQGNESRGANQYSHWVDTWAAAPQPVTGTSLPPAPFSTGGILVNATIRQTVYLSLGANQIRIRLANIFGNTNLDITAVTVALSYNGITGSSVIERSSLTNVTFNGTASCTVPVGALLISDPISLSVKSQTPITISIYTEKGQQTSTFTSHLASHTTSWLSLGNHVASGSLNDSSTISVSRWYIINTVEAFYPPPASAFVVIGDSITDGSGSATDKNNRWPNLLFRVMQNSSSTSNIAVINQGIGGNRILNDNTGPSVLNRFDRDVLSQSGVKYAMVAAGVNDIGKAATNTTSQSIIGDQLITAYKQLVIRAHTSHTPIFASTITPFGSSKMYGDPSREATRQRVNNWLRTNGTFDAIIDFDKILRDANNLTQLNPLYDSGDGLHPNVAGYTAIAQSWPLGVFSSGAGGYGDVTAGN